MNTRNKIRDVIELSFDGKKQREIARTTRVPRTTVQRIQSRLYRLPGDWKNCTDEELVNIIYPKTVIDYGKEPIDFEYIHSELTSHHNLTLTMLWEEYVAKCKAKCAEPYMYSQFAAKYREYALTSKVTMPLHRRPGVCEVDWSGDKGHYYDPEALETKDVHVFVGVLPYSQYFYIEGFDDESEENWISAHINMFHFFGGVPHTIINDNLKTGVNTPDKYEAVLQRHYNELGEHYNAVILPARSVTPHDKPSAEMSVNQCQQKILNAMRHCEVFSIEEWNVKARNILDSFLHANFKKKDEKRSRDDIFIQEEVVHLNPLPPFDYEMFEEVKRKVQFNYHVSVDNQFFSVPYKYVGKQVVVRYNKRTLIVFCNGLEIARHTDFSWKRNSYVTSEDHMPASHKFVAGWSKDRMLGWAEEIGPNTYKVCERIFGQRQYEEQSYKTVLGLLNTAKKKPKSIEKACELALTLPGKLSMRTIIALVPKDEDNSTSHAAKKTSSAVRPSGFLRGSYEGGEEDEQ